MKTYDIVIIGGGIAGLNVAYQLSRHHGAVSQHPRILLLESLDHLGGRIHTYQSPSWNNIPLEAGAGRFHKGHKHLVKLIGELGLSDKITPIGKPKLLHVSNGEEQHRNINIILRKILRRTEKISPELLRTKNIITLARGRSVVSDEEIDFLKTFYGYYSELEVMNSYDAIELMRHGTNVNIDFFVMNGGLTQIIEKMTSFITNAGVVRVLKNKNVNNVYRGGAVSAWVTPPNSARSMDSSSSKSKNFGGANITIRCIDGSEYRCKKCIFALPKPSLEKFAIFRGDGAPPLDTIACEPLCRIYSYYDNARNGWIKTHLLGKTTTDNMLRFIIPSGENIVMTSYTDYDFARWWKQKYDSGGVAAVNREITQLLRQTFGDRTIPVANKTRVFYWDCGVGYWRIGANSAEAAAAVLVGGDADAGDVYICGENYSEKNQQWMEGALETSARVVDMIL